MSDVVAFLNRQKIEMQDLEGNVSMFQRTESRDGPVCKFCSCWSFFCSAGVWFIWGSFIFCRCRWLPLQLWWSLFWLDHLELAGDESSREDALRFDAQSPRDETCLWEEGKQARNDPLNAVKSQSHGD